LKKTNEGVGVHIAKVYNKLETARSMVQVAREYLDARIEGTVRWHSRLLSKAPLLGKGCDEVGHHQT
jgi:hypothetical protein